MSAFPDIIQSPSLQHYVQFITTQTQQNNRSNLRDNFHFSKERFIQCRLKDVLLNHGCQVRSLTCDCAAAAISAPVAQRGYLRQLK